MKTAILAGGLGTRLAEETDSRPKPMVEIGGRPILVHIMALYARWGYKDFVVACGYKGDEIKDYFTRFSLHSSDLSVDLDSGEIRQFNKSKIDWTVDLVDTGLETMTGGRLARLRPYLGDSTFMATYGDGLSDIDIGALVAFHREHGKLATVTAVRPEARFGSLAMDADRRVTGFAEKVEAAEARINGGFFVLEPRALDYVDGDATPFEREPLERLASEGELMAFIHDGFWKPMDTVRDLRELERLWATGQPPWPQIES